MATKFTIIMNIHNYWIATRSLPTSPRLRRTGAMTIGRSFSITESLFFYRKKYLITTQRLLLSALLFCSMMHAADEQKREPSANDRALYEAMKAAAEKTTYSSNYLGVLAEKKMCWPEIKAFEQRPVTAPGKKRFYASLVVKNDKIKKQVGYLVSGSDAEGVHVIAQQLAQQVAASPNYSLNAAKKNALDIQQLEVKQIADIEVAMKVLNRHCDVLLPAEIDIQSCTHMNHESCQQYWPLVQECLNELIEDAGECHDAMALVPYIRESMILE